MTKKVLNEEPVRQAKKIAAATRWKKVYTKINGQKYHTGYELVRMGVCPDHPSKRSDDFSGVNEHGWIFRCGGLKPADVSGTAHPLDPPHYFVNAEPDGIAEQPALRRVSLDLPMFGAGATHDDSKGSEAQ